MPYEYFSVDGDFNKFDIVLFDADDFYTESFLNVCEHMRKKLSGKLYMLTSSADYAYMRNDVIVMDEGFCTEVMRISGVGESSDKTPSPVEEIGMEDDEYRRKISLACKSDVVVLLRGESGCGKNYFAKYIHEHSARRKGAFLQRSVADINPNLVESEFFGHVRGAYTGAEEHDGIFEKAAGGTLFLDELAELSLESQAKLLGILDTGCFMKVGSSERKNLDSRLIFATDANLEERIEKGLFKKQLYYRVRVLEIEIPPLRKRLYDLEHIAKNICRSFGKTVDCFALEKLKSYRWPGNIRELRNVLEVASLSSSRNVISPEDIVI